MIHHQDSLKVVVEGLGMQFIYADLHDANLGLDKVKDVDYPVLVYIAPTKKDSTIDPAGMIKRNVTVNCLILYKAPGRPDSSFTYTDMQPTIRAAEVMVDRLIHTLNKEDVTDREGAGIEQYEVTDTYSEFDAALYGVYLKFIWPVNELTRGC